MFIAYTVGITLIVVAGIAWSVLRVQDTLHPLVILLPMVAFFYVYMPLSLYHEQGALYFFTEEELIFVQGYNLLCVVALALGCYLSSWKRRGHPPRAVSFADTPYGKRRTLQFACVVGAIALLAYAHLLSNAGGLTHAYGRPYGGGRADSGYVRDLTLLVIPAITFFFLSRRSMALWSWKDWAVIAVLSTPLVLHGLLGARRGPTFMALATIFGGSYLVRRTRPRFSTVLVGGALVGLLVLSLVSLRGQLYLGSDFFSTGEVTAGEVVGQALEHRTQANLGNEFLYSTYVILNARDNDSYWNGRRYLTQIVVRPIPSAVWPTKYEDTGMQNIEFNGGALGPDVPELPSEVPGGAAPGFAAGEFVEWGWGGVGVIFLLGWLYGAAWQYSERRGGIWTVHYTVLLALSIFFISQEFLAVLFRYLFIMIPSVVFWQWAKRSRGRPDATTYSSHQTAQEASPG